MPKPVLGYWDIRGRAQAIRLLLTYSGTDFEDKRYGVCEGSPSWGADKSNLGLDFPNLPYWIDGPSKIEDQLKLTESKAILKYVAKTRGGGVLYPKTPELQAVADMVEGLVTDLQMALANVVYSATGIPKEPLEETQAEKFKQLNGFLTARQWALGENISFVDFFTYEYLKRYTKYNQDFLKPYPALMSYTQNFEALPELAKYIGATDKLVSYGPTASLKF